MINLLSYVGMNLQAELCMWTLLGLLRTIFDATLFKVNANLKQVWQMSMPAELSMPVQRALRTMISGVMLVQCFTVYVYLASYIVLLYPVFLEERPTLVLPWLLLAAIRKFLCELTSLALGLGACVLLGPARPPCIKFVITKIASITPTFYLWMLVFSYYNTLKVTAAFKTFPAVLQSSDHDYGLELAVRRRRTKSLQDEEQLRKKLVASFYEPNHHTTTVVETPPTSLKTDILISSRTLETIVVEDIKPEIYVFRPFSVISERLMSNLGTYEDWCGNEVTLPRDTDRILEQFVLMLLRISAYMKSDATDPAKLFSSSSPLKLPYGSLDCTTLPNEDTEPPPQVGNSKGRTASYLQEYPQIFNKKASESLQHTPEQLLGTSHSVANHNEINNIVGALRSNKQDSTAVKMLSPEPAAVINLKNVSVPKIADKKNKKMALQDIEENETFKQKSGSGIKDVDIKLTIETQAVIDVYNSEDNLITPKVGKHDFLNDSKCKEIEMKTDGNIVNVNDDIKDNASISVSVDSIQSIIDRMKDSLSQNKKFSDKDKNKYETNGPSSSHLPKDRI